MKTIVVPVDFSDVTPKLVEVVQKFAGAFGSRVILLHVVYYQPPTAELMPGLAMPGSIPVVVEPFDSGVVQQRLAQEKSKFSGTSIEVATMLTEGHAVEEILEAAETEKADLIIIGSHGHGAIYHLLAGSVTEGVLKSAKCPVLVVPSK